MARGVRLADYAFAQCACIREILLSPGCVMGKYALSQCTALRALTLPPNLAGEDAAEGRVPEGLMSGCRGLEMLCLPGEIREVGSFAFSDCTRLTRLHLPGVQRLEAYACYREEPLSRW